MRFACATLICLSLLCSRSECGLQRNRRLISQTDPVESSEEDPDQTQFPSEIAEDVKLCKDECVAQWKTDFNVYFQKNYDRDFYEFPLDATVTSSKKDFLAFCRMTSRKIACFKKECRVHRRRIPWSPDVHLCIYKKRQFLNSLQCFNSTAAGAHEGCNRYCAGSSSEYYLKPEEKKYLTSLQLSVQENSTYLEMRVKCYFQICQHECRKGLMKQLCDNKQKTTAVDTLLDYYTHDHLDQYQALANQNLRKVFPLICRTLLPQRYQVVSPATKVVKRDFEALRRATKNKVAHLLSATSGGQHSRS